MKKKFLLAIPPLLAIILFLILPKEKPDVEKNKHLYKKTFNYNDIKIKEFIRADMFRLEDDNVVLLDGISCAGGYETFRLNELNITRADRERLRKEADELITNILMVSYSSHVQLSGKRDAAHREYCYIFVRTFGDATSFRPEKDVFVKAKDGYQIFLNAYLVRMGYALSSNDTQDEYTGLLSKLESRAKNEGLGVWSRTK